MKGRAENPFGQGGPEFFVAQGMVVIGQLILEFPGGNGFLDPGELFQGHEFTGADRSPQLEDFRVPELADNGVGQAVDLHRMGGRVGLGRFGPGTGTLVQAGDVESGFFPGLHPAPFFQLDIGLVDGGNGQAQAAMELSQGGQALARSEDSVDDIALFRRPG